jgi:uncharacterized protein YprB with RNaseH-like and TPR domain
MLSYCIKRRGGEILKRSITPGDIKAHRFDLPLCQQFLEDIGDFDRLVTYYGTGYDMPFIRTRCLFHKLDAPAAGSVFHTDLYYTVRNRLKLHRNRMEVACDILDIPSKGHRLTPQVWQRAQAGDQKSIDYVVQHNIEDVESLSQLWDRLYGQFKVNKTSI